MKIELPGDTGLALVFIVLIIMSFHACRGCYRDEMQKNATVEVEIEKTKQMQIELESKRLRMIDSVKVVPAFKYNNY